MNRDFISKKCSFSFNEMILLFCLFFCVIDCFALVPPYVSQSAWNRYMSNWYTVSVDKSEQLIFHANFGKVIAETKLNRNPDQPDNIAAFGFTLRSGEDGSIIKSIAILPLVCSTIDQIRDPIVSADGKSAITVRDLLGEDILHKKHRVHKVLEMAEWLVPWEYTKGWNMQDLITYERSLILQSYQKPDKDILTRLTILKPVEPKIGKAAGDIFHCEQVVIYKMLTDSEFLSKAVDELMEGVIERLPSKICLDFDIITFNDMCPKCFSTAFFRFDEMKSEISKQIFLYFQRAKRTELLSQKLPIIFRILVSSSRPYKIETEDVNSNLRTRECSSCKTDSAGPCPFVKSLVTRHVSVNGERADAIPIENGVFQFVNPWIEEFFRPIKERYQTIKSKIEELKAERERLSHLPIDTKDLQEKIQTKLSIIRASISSVKNLLLFKSETLDRLDELLKQTRAVQ